MDAVGEGGKARYLPPLDFGRKSNFKIDGKLQNIIIKLKVLKSIFHPDYSMTIRRDCLRYSSD
jgi:hypothetical protein